MTKLLRANFARLKTSKVFWICTIGMFVFAVGLCVDFYVKHVTEGRSFPDLDLPFYVAFFLTGVVGAVFCSIFIGTEYSDGTLRNKLVVGHSRSAIYLANFLTCSIAELFMVLAYQIGMMAVGAPLCGWFKADAASVLFTLMIGILLTIAHAAIFSLLAMLISNKVFPAILGLIFAFVSIFMYVTLINRLQEPEFHSGFETTVSADGVITAQYGEATPNPNFLTPVERERVQFVMDFLPTTQAGQLVAQEAANPARMVLCSFAIILTTNAAGIFFFRRKDLK